MHYERLLQVTSQYSLHGVDGAYVTVMRRLDWHGPRSDMTRNLEAIEDFLGAWGSTRGGLPDRQQLAATWMKDIEPYAKALESETIEGYDPDKLTTAGPETLRVGVALEHMYGALLQMPTVGPTNASKILHLRLPDLVVMTDTEVRHLWNEMYRSELSRGKLFDPYCYAFRFHWYVHAELKEAIVSLCHERHLGWAEAVDSLRNAHDRQRSLAKLCDEYYYMETR